MAQAEHSKSKNQSEERIFAENLLKKQRNIYENFKDSLKAKSAEVTQGSIKEDKLSYLLNELSTQNQAKVQELAQLKAHPDNNDGQDLLVSTLNPFNISFANSTTNQSFISSLNEKDNFLEQIQKSERKIEEQILHNQDQTLSLKQKITELVFSMGKMKREMKDIEKENDILDSKLERMEDLQIAASKKSEAKKTLEVQKREMDSLDAKNNDLHQKLMDSKYILTYIETLIKLEKLVQQGENGEEIDIEQKENLEDEQALSSSRSSNPATSRSTNKGMPQKFQRVLISDDNQTEGKAEHQQGSSQRSSQKQQKEIDRAVLLQKINSFYNSHGKGPEEIVGYLISKFQESNLNLQSLETCYAELSKLKTDKSRNLVSLYAEMNALSLGGEVDDDNPLTTLLQQPLDYFKDQFDVALLATNKLSQSYRNLNRISFSFFFNLVEILFRYNCILKLHFDKRNNMISDEEVTRFFDDFSRFICTFRLGIAAKRNFGIDPTKYVTEIMNANVGEVPSSPSNSNGLKEAYTPRVRTSVHFAFSDAVKSQKTITEIGKGTFSGTGIEDEKLNKCAEKFLEKLNFIPFSRQELAGLFVQVFPDVVDNNNNDDDNILLRKWQNAIKGSIMEFYISEARLVQCLQEKVSDESEDISVHSEAAAVAVDAALTELSNEAQELHSHSIEKIFWFFQKVICELMSKTKNREEKCGENGKFLGSEHMSQTDSQISNTEVSKRYTNHVLSKKEAFLNFQGEMVEPITEKKKIMKNLKDTTKENVNCEDLKKVIFRLAKNEPKAKLAAFSSAVFNANQQFACYSRTSHAAIATASLSDRNTMKSSRSSPTNILDCSSTLPSLAQQQDKDELDLIDPSLREQLKLQQMNEFEYLNYERTRGKREVVERYEIYKQTVATQNELAKKKAFLEAQAGANSDRNHPQAAHKNPHYNKQENKNQGIFARKIESDKIIWKLQQLERRKDLFDNKSVFMKIKNPPPRNLEDISINIGNHAQSKDRLENQQMRLIHSVSSPTAFSRSSLLVNLNNASHTQMSSSVNPNNLKLIQNNNSLKFPIFEANEDTLPTSEECFKERTNLRFFTEQVSPTNRNNRISQIFNRTNSPLVLPLSGKQDSVKECPSRNGGALPVNISGSGNKKSFNVNSIAQRCGKKSAEYKLVNVPAQKLKGSGVATAARVKKFNDEQSEEHSMSSYAGSPFSTSFMSTAIYRSAALNSSIEQSPQLQSHYFSPFFAPLSTLSPYEQSHNHRSASVLIPKRHS